MTALVTGSKRAPLRERRDDLYQTPACAVDALLRVERLPHNIWEPADGRGAISRPLRAAGHIVVATDLVDYGIDGAQAGVDFLMEWQAPAGVECIVTNPPFKLANEFVEHALDLCPIVVMLLRLAFIESRGRARILDGGHLARVYPFANRLPTMHRDGWVGTRSSNAIAYAWFIWDRAHQGPTEMRRISWVPSSASGVAA